MALNVEIHYVVYWSLNPQILTCLSRLSDSRSFAVAIQGDHSDIVFSIWEQLQQQSLSFVPWYQNLYEDTGHVREIHFSRVSGHQV